MSLSKEVAFLKRELRSAKSKYRRKLRALQAECSHPIAYFSKGTNSYYLGRSPARRMCCNCLIEEYSMWGTESSWSVLNDRFGNHINEKPLLNNSAIHVISSDRYNKLRA